jgi:hypothetical protein
VSNLGVAVPAGGPPTWALTRSLLGLRGPGDGGFVFNVAEGLSVEQARNLLVERFLQTPAEWLLFVDRDAALHPQTVLRLMSWNVPVVGALAFARTEPPAPTIYAGEDPADVDAELRRYRINWEETKGWLLAHKELQTNHPVVLGDRPDDALVRVDFTGMHCTLIRRDVLERLTPGPWFERMHPVGSPRGCGEDYDFCRKVRAAGFDIYVDRSVQAGHLAGDRSIGGLAFLAYDAITDYVTGGFDVGRQKEE